MGILDGLFGGSAPTAPDPYKTSQAQLDLGIGSSQASNILNNPNISNPFGQVNYKATGSETVTGPDGKQIKVPRYTQETTLSPEMQGQFDQRNALISQIMGGMDFSQPIDFSQFNPVQTSGGTQAFNPSVNSGQLSFGYRPEGGFSADRRRVEDAVMSRGTELLSQNRDNEVARLAAMGLTPGGEAYGRVADQFERSSNDMAMQAVLAGGQEQSRLLGEARNEGLFGNNAIAQAFGMDTGLTQMENNRRMQEAAFGNQARSQQIAELLGERGAGLSELAAMSSFMPGMPQAPGFQGQGVDTPNLMESIYQKYQADVDAYNNKASGIGSLLGTGLKVGLGMFGGPAGIATAGAL